MHRYTHCIPNNVQEDVNFVSPQKALAMGKSNMDYSASGGGKSKGRTSAPKRTASPKGY